MIVVNKRNNAQIIVMVMVNVINLMEFALVIKTISATIVLLKARKMKIYNMNMAFRLKLGQLGLMKMKSSNCFNILVVVH